VFSITPNNDGVNDTWRIQGIESFNENIVSIFNRWGDTVFQADGYDNENVVWDGTNNGNELGAGTYFYIIEIVNGPSSSGWIQLMK
jgi:gliding motility-associated-like protein